MVQGAHQDLAGASIDNSIPLLAYPTVQHPAPESRHYDENPIVGLGGPFWEVRDDDGNRRLLLLACYFRAHPSPLSRVGWDEGSIGRLVPAVNWCGLWRCGGEGWVIWGKESVMIRERCMRAFFLSVLEKLLIHFLPI